MKLLANRLLLSLSVTIGLALFSQAHGEQVPTNSRVVTLSEGELQSYKDRLELLEGLVEKRDLAMSEYQRRLLAAQKHIQNVDVRYFEALKAQNTYTEEWYTYRARLDAHAERVLAWQFWAGVVVSIVTLAVIVLSISFAVLQLRDVLSPAARLRNRLRVFEDFVADTYGSARRTADEKAELLKRRKEFREQTMKSLLEGGDEKAVTRLVLGPSGVEVQTAASWVLVIVMSFALLYLFLNEVFSLEPIEIAQFSSSENQNEQGGQVSTQGALGASTASPTLQSAPSETPKSEANCPPGSHNEACDPPGE